MASDTAFELCGHCLEPLEKTAERRKLTCGHGFCLTCLKADRHSEGKIFCLICRLVIIGVSVHGLRLMADFTAYMTQDS